MISLKLKFYELEFCQKERKDWEKGMGRKGGEDTFPCICKFPSIQYGGYYLMSKGCKRCRDPYVPLSSGMSKSCAQIANIRSSVTVGKGKVIQVSGLLVHPTKYLLAFRHYFPNKSSQDHVELCHKIRFQIVSLQLFPVSGFVLSSLCFLTVKDVYSSNKIISQRINCPKDVCVCMIFK